MLSVTADPQGEPPCLQGERRWGQATECRLQSMPVAASSTLSSASTRNSACTRRHHAARGGRGSAGWRGSRERVSALGARQRCVPAQAGYVRTRSGASKLRCSAVRVTQRRTAGNAVPTKGLLWSRALAHDHAHEHLGRVGWLSCARGALVPYLGVGSAVPRPPVSTCAVAHAR